MAEKISVFLSSTRLDLRPHRLAVEAALRQAGYLPVGMEDFGARDGKPVDVCLREVGEAALFVGVYAWRYGFIPPGESCSITEMEFQEAERWQKPRLCFFLDETFPWPDEYRDPGEAGDRLRAFKAEVGRDRVVGRFTTPDSLATQVLASLAQWQHERAAPVTPERRRELDLVEKVQRSWVAAAPSPVVRIELPREERALAAALAIVPADEGRPADPHRPLLNLFLDHGKSLLIRGDQGSGKSWTLRQLFVGLADRARRDPAMPVPVLFNLASWSEPKHGRRLEAWLAQQLGPDFYGVAARLATEWIEKDQVLPLLDGLDEVDLDSRPACVEAINAFLGQHGLLGMALCCRNAALDELTVPLRLEAEIALQPLAAEQIAATLAGAGPEVEAVRDLLASDPEWRKLAESPLMLDLLARTYRGASSQAVAAGLGGEGERPRRVFAGYVAAMLDRKGEVSRYSPAETRRALAWLAGRMQERGMALFRIEELQPSWLAGRAERLSYAVLSRAAGGILLALPVAALWAHGFWLFFGLFGGALVGVTDAWRLGRSAAGNPDGGLGRTAARVALIASEAFLAVLLLGLLLLWKGEDRGSAQALNVRFGLLGGILFALVFGLVFGLRGARRDGGNDIQVGQGLVWSRWSWRGMWKSALWGMAALLAGWGVLRLSVTRRAYDSGVRTLGWLFLLLVGSLLCGLAGGVLGGLETKPLETRVGPNRGVWLALRNAGLIGLCVLVATVIGVGGIVWGSYALALRRGEAIPGSLQLAPPLLLGFTLALWIGLWASGLDFLQHFTLRLLLAWRSPVPVRYARFLDHAADHRLLPRVGGGYRFFHRLLQEYFAAPGGSAEAGAPPPPG